MKKLILINQYYYIVDTEAIIEEGDYIQTIIDKIILFKGGFRTALDFKVIATNNPSLSIPQLSKQAIQLIVKNNGKLEDFDTCPYYINGELINVDIEIYEKEVELPSFPEDKLQKIAYDLYKKLDKAIFFHYEDRDIWSDGFEEGYKHAESKMYSEDEVLNKLNSFYIWTQQQIIDGKRFLNSEDIANWFNSVKKITKK